MNALVAICSVVAPATSSPAPADTSWYGNTHHGEGFVNVKDSQFGAKGDGVTDDTAALQLAINHNRLQAGLPPAPTQRPFAPPSRAVVYLPPGTYVVSDTLVLWFFTHLRGSTLDPPTVLLKSAAAGFGDAGALKPILATAGGCNQSVPWWSDNFHANDMFYNQIHSLRIDAGRGNSGAVGVYWSIAQQTSIRDLRIEGARVGIDVAVTRGYATPLHSAAGLGGGGTIEDVVIVGGDVGMRCEGSQYTMRGLTFRGQQTAAIQVAGDVWTFVFASVTISNVPVVMEVLAPGFSETNVLLLDVALHNISNPTAAIILPEGGISLVLENISLGGAHCPHALVAAGPATWVDSAEYCTPAGGGGGAVECLVDRWAGYGGQGSTHDTPNGIWVENQLAKAPRQRLPFAREQALPSRPRPWFDHLTLGNGSNGSTRGGGGGGGGGGEGGGCSSSSSSGGGVSSGGCSGDSRSAPTICNAVTACGAKGDNKTDDTPALQHCFRTCGAVFLPSGIYKCTDTLKLNSSTVLVGEALTQLYLTQSAAGFGNPASPKVFVDTPDDPDGAVLITDVSMQAGWGNEGAVMMRWRVGAASGMWDVHINISHNVHVGLHVGGSGAGVISNMWGWGADHAQWTGEHMSEDAADIGFLGDSPGPLWCFGVAFEHHRTAMFSLLGASNYVFLALQTEQAWWLPPDQANDTVHLALGQGTANVTVYGELHCSWAARSQTTITQMVSVSPGVKDGVSIFGLRDIGAAEAVNQPGMEKMPRPAHYSWLDVVADVGIMGKQPA